MSYSRAETIDATPTGDTVKEAILKNDTDLTNIFAHLNTHEGLTSTHGLTGDIVGTSDTQTLSNKTLTSPVINVGVSGTAILDEDDLATDSATQLATQQSIKAYVDNLEVINAQERLVHNLCGFEDKSTCTLSWNNATRELTVTFDSTTYYWASGVRYTKTGSDTLAISDDTSSGINVFYYAGATLTTVLNPTHSQLDTIIIDNAIVAIVYWNKTDADTVVLADERHGAVMSGETHHYLHDTVGAMFREGAALTNYTLDTASDAAISFNITDIVFYDEDLEIAVTDGVYTNQYEQVLNTDAVMPCLYRDDVDGSWTQLAASTLPYMYVSSQPTINNDDGDGTFSQLALSNVKFMNYFMVVTNDWEYPVKMIQGDTEYANSLAALAGAETEIGGWSTLPTAEWVLMYQLIMQQSVGGTKELKIVEIVDYRFSRISGASGASVSDHGSLGGLGDDDHALYLLASDATDRATFAANWLDLTDAGETALHKHDSMYYTETELDGGQLDNRYYTETEVDTWRNSVTQTEMGYLHGVTSDIQTQIGTKAADADVLKKDGSVALTGDWNAGAYDILAEQFRGRDGEITYLYRYAADKGIQIGTDGNVTVTDELSVGTHIEDATPANGFAVWDTNALKQMSAANAAAFLVSDLSDTFYTETELDGGQLDNRYYTETELDAGQLDNRYFTEAEHINSSAGAGDAGKPVKLDAAGHIDATMINDADIDHASVTNTHNLTTDIDHDAITNYVANEHIDHTTVTLTAGTGLSGGGDISSNRSFALSHLGIESLTDPGSDKILFWDDSETATGWLTLGTNLSISTTTINVDAHSSDHDDRFYTETELDAGQLDNRYYTESEIDTSLADYLPLAGGTMTGQLYGTNARFTGWTAAVGGAAAELGVSGGEAYFQAYNRTAGDYINANFHGEDVSLKAFANLVIDAVVGVSGTAIKDEDTMSSNSAVHLATQQSIKAYVDAEAGGGFATGTKMWFYQASAPTGWTTDSSLGDAVLACHGSSDYHGSSGGGVQDGSWTMTGISLAASSLTAANLPSSLDTYATNVHRLAHVNLTYVNSYGTVALATNNKRIATTSSANTDGVKPDHRVRGTSGSTHTHTLTQGSTYRPYANVGIIASKD